MKKNIKYTNESMGDIEITEDFLPPPEELVLKKSKSNVTIILSDSSIAFFKREAEKHHTDYQKIIRNILEDYVARNIH